MIDGVTKQKLNVALYETITGGYLTRKGSANPMLVSYKTYKESLAVTLEGKTYTIIFEEARP
jgi:hypothetical protein